MNKVNFLIFVACVFIGFVMVTLMDQGVRLKERRMVKWSGVDSASKAGTSIALHMYPLLQERDSLVIIGDDDFSEEFAQAFQSVSQQKNVKTKVQRGDTENTDPLGLTLRVLKLPETPDCPDENKPCLQKTSLNKFKKKERDPKKLWIQMWRTGKNTIQLFYR